MWLIMNLKSTENAVEVLVSPAEIPRLTAVLCRKKLILECEGVAGRGTETGYTKGQHVEYAPTGAELHTCAFQSFVLQMYRYMSAACQLLLSMYSVKCFCTEHVL